MSEDLKQIEAIRDAAHQELCDQWVRWHETVKPLDWWIDLFLEDVVESLMSLRDLRGRGSQWSELWRL